MLGGDPLERTVCELYTRYCEYSKSLEDDRGRDRVRQCCLLTSCQKGLEGDREWQSHLLTSFQEGTQEKLFFQGIFFVANWIIVDIAKYSGTLLSGQFETKRCP